MSAPDVLLALAVCDLRHADTQPDDLRWARAPSHGLALALTPISAQ